MGDRASRPLYSTNVFPVTPNIRFSDQAAINDIFLCMIVESRMPTTAQALKCFELCCNLTSKYCSIDLATLDRRTGNVILLTREEINIEIEPSGEWRFV
jgi:hypothetical protein